MTEAFELVPYRFSTHPAAMIAFLELLGLTRETTTARDGFAILRGRSGKVAVHAAGEAVTGTPAGETQLSFEVADAQKAADTLSDAGLPAIVWDESYGRHAGVREPRGGGVWINEVMADHYGYERDAATRPDRVEVVAVYYTTDFAAGRDFFAALGFTPAGSDEGGWQPLRAAEGAGTVGLHAIDTDPALPSRSPDDPIGPPAVIDLSFETAAPLDTLAERLRAAGHADAVVAEDHGLRRVIVTDPDGQRLEIHSTS